MLREIERGRQRLRATMGGADVGQQCEQSAE